MQRLAHVKKYAGGPEGNRLDILIAPPGKGSTFTFDGLSSGQKEVISTLFLIGQRSREANALVLVDEPELHLNVEWHAGLIEEMCQVAPSYQLILATHSPQVFGSVPRERRLLLESDWVKVKFCRVVPLTGTKFGARWAA